ncbi:hypothetical protein PIB30_081259 [Stylosanthes scabra]|uniref:Uncharacterized protein n=1 Tax=Stylosanthes scabra TaxID=79078 RepID=A0ABU6UUA4_9FABA|nr:hypothetical protein [Stylosanthes scabra]
MILALKGPIGRANNFSSLLKRIQSQKMILALKGPIGRANLFRLIFVQFRQKMSTELAPQSRIREFSSQSSASWPNSVSLGASSNPSPQTLIHSSPNSQHSDFANPRGLDFIDLNDDEIGNQRQRSTPLWQWEEDRMLISAWLNISTDHVVGTDQKSNTFWNRINNYCEEHNPTMKRNGCN